MTAAFPSALAGGFLDCLGALAQGEWRVVDEVDAAGLEALVQLCDGVGVVAKAEDVEVFCGQREQAPAVFFEEVVLVFEVGHVFGP